MRRLAEQFGVEGDTFVKTPVGVFFGRDGAARAGPSRWTTRTSVAPARKRAACVDVASA